MKCPTPATYIAWRQAGVVPDEHKPQMLAQLACTRRRYCDFVAFDPRMPPDLQLFVRRFTPTVEQIAGIETAAKDFLQELEAMFVAFTTAGPVQGIEIDEASIPY